jgi:hypothetical protein
MIACIIVFSFCLDRLGGVFDSFILHVMGGYSDFLLVVFLLQALADIKGFFGEKSEDYS